MRFYRLIKPDWAKPTLANGDANPKFVREIEGPNTIEGSDYPNEFLKAMNEQGYNLYWFPNHPSKDVYKEGVPHLSSKHIDVFDYVYVDMDLKDKVYASKQDFLNKLASFPLKPTVVVDSGNGIHAYWQISDLTRDMFVITNLGLLTHFNTDKSVFTVMQLLRLPGFFNTKLHDKFIEAKVLEDASSGEIYSMDQIPKSIYQLPEDVVLRGQNHLNKIDGKLKIDLGENINIDEVPDRFVDLLLDPKNIAIYNLFHDPKGSYGDRSGADMKLANILYKQGFNKKEAFGVIANTEKALSHANRLHYAEITIDKVYTDKLNAEFLTVGQKLRTNHKSQELGELVKGPWYLDFEVLGNPWRKKEVLGLIAGTGVGKTAVALEIVKETIQNNPEKDDVYVFFTLEMPESDIINRWILLVGKDSPLADRLYVIDNQDDEGHKEIGLQEVYDSCMRIKQLTGKNIGIVVIDHLIIMSRRIDTKHKHTFGIDSEENSGYGQIRRLGLNSMATHMKTLAKMLDTYVIPLTQTTKGKGVGDVPIDKDGAYGISQYENVMDRIMTLWQPLKLVQHMTKTRFLAWQYAKIRAKHPNDKVQTNEQKLMTYVMESGHIRATSLEEYQEFQKLLPLAAQARDNIDKKKANGYSIQINQNNLNEVANLLTAKIKDEKNVPKVQPH